MKRITVKDSAIKRLRNFYLWVFRDELQPPVMRCYPGEIVTVQSRQGEDVGTAFYHPSARVALRMISRVAIRPDGDFWRDRLQEALCRRQPLLAETNARRLVHAEGDYLPGLVADHFGDHLVLQFRTAGMDHLRPLIVSLFAELLAPASIYERSDLDRRREEGLPPVEGQLAGTTPERVEVLENGLRFVVDIRSGQKTGFYTDQRDARRHFAGLVRDGDEVLDAFCYTGGFAVAAARQGARVIGVDKDEAALTLAGENARLNGVESRVVRERADVFQWLPEQAAAGRRFQLIGLDPPALIKYKNQQGKGRGLLMDLLRPCLQMLPAGGRLHLSTCAYHLNSALVTEAIRIVAGELGKRIVLLARTMQAADHPVVLQMPETWYLRGYTLQVLSG
ncbi:MAG: class I SAM-dependent rRNA methyltransferase [Acidobacteria bacterium]|nr:class I SAM-dependent rRNA methyltransferase [Acidobacteriota bacterium]